MIGRGRVVRAKQGAEAAPRVLTLREGPSALQRKRITRERIEGQLEADRLVFAAKERAEAVLDHARAMSAGAAAEGALAGARAAERVEQSKLAANYLALRAAEESQDERGLDRTIALAVLLAERLVGAAVELDPSLVARLARQALAEARGARRARIEAHPLDAESLRAHLSSVGLPPESIEVVPKEGLARGDLCLHTDLGTLDAKLHPQLERLAAALRDALG